ncbi:hypothetical protein HUT19_21100 [Streptomyces sp. NA02950]|uniref:hypothetical protein n=1 Tax=Streptomyces sp. NA02950 TaxID=2742137 RepID=UPI0015912501|nr:hypothetical protein [Streptomyces sp. NA02950]QKV93945.1 hypothetical protein HUT19_21100 [Streptomyces sp. NA02950]
MANNPQGPNGNQDPAGSTQMFRAFVDDGGRQPQPTTASSGGSRIGVIVGVIVAIAVIGAVAWLALS